MVNILLPDDDEKFRCPNSGHLDMHSMHICNLISKRFKVFDSKPTAMVLNSTPVKR